MRRSWPGSSRLRTTRLFSSTSSERSKPGTESSSSSELKPSFVSRYSITRCVCVTDSPTARSSSNDAVLRLSFFSVGASWSAPAVHLGPEIAVSRGVFSAAPAPRSLVVLRHRGDGAPARARSSRALASPSWRNASARPQASPPRRRASRMTASSRPSGWPRAAPRRRAPSARTRPPVALPPPRSPAEPPRSRAMRLRVGAKALRLLAKLPFGSADALAPLRLRLDLLQAAVVALDQLRLRKPLLLELLLPRTQLLREPSGVAGGQSLGSSRASRARCGAHRPPAGRARRPSGAPAPRRPSAPRRLRRPPRSSVSPP